MYELKLNCCLFERLFKVRMNGIFLFGISFSLINFIDIHILRKLMTKVMTLH